MNKVITINLNGRAYQLEEVGYDALRRYLDQAAAKLDGNPDKDEIMADFEQAIADKCDLQLSARKNVITAAEIESIIKAMGPVNAGDASAPSDSTGSGVSHDRHSAYAATGAKPKRLFQIREGAWIAGVCNGLAAYFNLDVTLMRVIFIVLGILTHGAWILVYIVLALVLPVARTPDELDEALGTIPFNAHDFIENAKARYAEFKETMPHDPTNPEERRKWKEDMRAWKRKWKEDMRAEHQKWRDWHREQRWARHEHPGGGFLRFVLRLILAALFVFFLVALVAVIQHGVLFGVTIAAGYPLWVSIVFVCALFYLISTPFRLFVKNSHPWRWGRYSFFNDLMQSIFFIFAIYLVIVLGRELFPAVNSAYETVRMYLATTFR